MKEIQDPPHPQQAPTLGSYHLSEMLGHGPAGHTHLAERQDQPEHYFALKTFDARPLHTSQEQEEVLRDVGILQHLQHRSILPILEAWISEDLLYLVSPYAPGGSLQHILFSASNFPPLPLPEALAILKQVGEALQVAHKRQLVHANLKPENILFHLEGYALLTDFRLPVLTPSALAPHPSSTFAARYMAPEQFRDEKPTPQSDQYALACVAWELLTGSTPFEATTFEELCHKHLTEPPVCNFSPDHEQLYTLSPVFLRALAKKSEERYPTVQAFLSALDTALMPTPVQPMSQIDTSLPVMNQVQPAPDALVLPAPPHMRAPADALTSAFPSPIPTHSLVTSAVLPPRSPILSPHAHPRVGSPAAQKSGWVFAITISLIMFLVLSGLLLLLYPLLAPVYHSALHPTPANAGRAAIIPTTGQTPAPVPTLAATPAPTIIPTTGSSSLAQSCAVNYTVNTQWPGGFVATIKIFNLSPTPVNGWTLTFIFAENQTITHGWNGSYHQNGTQVSIANVFYNTQIAPSASVNPGFQATWSNANPPPTSFALNGTICSLQ